MEIRENRTPLTETTPDTGGIKEMEEMKEMENNADRMRLFSELDGEEDVSRRGENIKHFHLGGNRYQAVVYPEAVHYKENDESSWEEIDNNLELTVAADGRGMLRNKAGAMRIELSENPKNGSLVSLTHKGHTLAWSFERAVDTIVPTVTAGEALKRERLVERVKTEGLASRLSRRPELMDLKDLKVALETAQERRSDRTEKSSQALYKNLLPGVSVRYTLSGNQIKEDILLENRAALEYAVLRLPDTYDYIVNDDQSVSVMVRKMDEEPFRFQAPLVYDADGKTTLAMVKVEPRKGYVRMRYELDDAYLETAAFPVTIDPVIQSSPTSSVVEDTTLLEGSSTKPYAEGYFKVGVESSKRRVGLLRFKKLAGLKTSDTVIQALLRLMPKSGSSSKYVAAYDVNQDWVQTTVNWPSFNPMDEAYVSKYAQECIPGASGAYVLMDLTNLYRKWCMMDENGNSRNFGVALRRPDNLSGDNYQEFYSVEASSGSNRPVMYLNYISHAGLEGWWQYESQSAGRAGTANVDLFNGNMVLEHVDTRMNGNLMPVSVNHYYNSCLSDSNRYFCGNGWKTSAHQYVRRNTIESAVYYIWTDGDGTEHFFPETSSQPYKDAEGMGLEFRYYNGSSSSTNDDYMIITDKENNEMRFDRGANWSYAWLTAARDAHDNRANYYYGASEGMLTRIVDGAGRETTFSYSGNLLSSIQTPGAEPGTYRTVYYTYTNQCLTGVRYSDLGGSQLHTTYGYDGTSNILTSARNYDGLQVNIAYEPQSLYNDAIFTNGSSAQMRRVLGLETVHTNATGTVTSRGAKQVLTYLLMCTEVLAVDSTEVVSGKTVNHGKKLIYQFNDSGNVVCVRDELGFAQFTKYSSSFDNTPEDDSKLQKVVVNRLIRPDLYSGWTAVKAATADTAARDVTTANLCLNTGSVKLIKTTATGETLYQQQVKLERGKSWSLSAYVKTSGVTGTGAFMRIKPVTAGEAPTKTSEVLTGTNGVTTGNGLPTDGWERLHMMYETPAGSGEVSVYVELVHAGSGGTAWFACPQLEEGPFANPVNFISNGDFRYRTLSGSRYLPDIWTLGANNATSAENSVIVPGEETDPDEENDFPAALSGNYAQVQGRPSMDNVGYVQTIYMQGAANDIFVLGGWAKARSKPRARKIGSGFGFAVRYMDNNDAWSDYKMLPMNSEWVGWQYGCFPFRIPAKYKRLQVLCVYTKNVNTAKFSNVFLYREEFGRSFGFDSKKNMTSIGNLAMQKAGMDYDDFNNLTSYRQPGRPNEDQYKYKMTYGSTDADKKKHRLRTSTTPEGVKTSYTYDSKGNVLTTTIQKASGEPLIKTATAYTDDKNYATSKTDARGNMIFQDVNPNTGTLSMAMDPNGTAVFYEYDNAERVTRVHTSGEEEGDTGYVPNYQNTYTYENDRLKTVTHNTSVDGSGNPTGNVTYTFDYDEMGNQTSVKVGSRTLSTNVYASDLSKKLERVEHGNGQKVHYTYDDFDRLTAVGYEDGIHGTGPSYEYIYGANGEMGLVKDHDLNRTQWTEYDLAMRPRQTTTRDDGTGALLYRTTLKYDKLNNLIQFDERVGSAAYQSTYEYDKDNRTKTVQYGDTTRKVAYTFDTVGRVSRRAVTNGSGTYQADYGFVVGGHGASSTTPLVGSITQGSGANAMNFTYDYDNVGNITSETRNGAVTEYGYDQMGQLTYVNDPHEDVVWLYEYDRGGNILKKERYTRLSDGSMGALQETIPYAYGDADWKDLLTSYSGKPITYDAIGNLKTYDGWTYTWQAGRQLQKMEKETKKAEFTYDANGLRAQKKVTEGSTVTTTDYTLHGKLVTHLQQGSDNLHFFYDAQNWPAMVNFNGTLYTYVHNLQGDIVAIVDSAGTMVVEYKYDAWGKPLTGFPTGTLKDTLGKLNPFRYRGYVWDQETGCYYLRTRYYDPQMGRFICLDNTEIAFNSDRHMIPLAMNLYAYGYNNPIQYIDAVGEFGWLAFAGGSGIISLAASVGSTNFWNPIGWFAVGVLAVVVAVQVSEAILEARKPKLKPVNLPSHKTVKINMIHVASGHSAGGNRGGPNKDRFPTGMEPIAIERAIREAYRLGEKIYSQDGRVFMRGPWGKYLIEMYVNTITKEIETAWPKYRLF